MRFNPNKVEEWIFFAISAGAAVVSCLFLFMIIVEVIIHALPSLTWYFVVTPESATPHIGMGIANAIWGSILISLFATVLALPLALGTAVYLQKYAKKGRLMHALRFFIEVLSGTPSIVIGIFGLLVLVYLFRPITGGFSLLSGSIALAILIMPVMERSIEDAICSIPLELEEGSYALGANKWQTIRQITLPTAISGIVTGAILGFGRAAEESAVVILTAGYSQFMPEFAIKSNPNLLGDIKIYPIQDLVGTLPYSVYHAYENSNIIPMSNGFAAAFILIAFVLLINFLAKVVIKYCITGMQSPSPVLSRNLLRIDILHGKKSLPIPTPASAAIEFADAEGKSNRYNYRSPPTTQRISTTSEINWKETLSAGLQMDPVQEIGSTIRRGDSSVVPEDSPPQILKYSAIPDSINANLFEDEPGLLSEEPGNDPKLAFTPDYPLLEEDPDTLITESPADEPWRRMARNRLENTIAGVTADPWEEP